MSERLIRENHNIEYQHKPTMETIHSAIRKEDLLKRLDTCISIIGNLCSEHRNPCMSIPCQPYDEDMFICETIKEAIEKLKDKKDNQDTFKGAPVEWQNKIIEKP